MKKKFCALLLAAALVLTLAACGKESTENTPSNEPEKPDTGKAEPEKEG